jgi:hypothetical protein
MVEGEKSDSGVSWPAGSPESDVAYAAGQDQAAIRTRAWFLRRLRGDRGWHDELFAKPDDRWEANEIASRCSDVVELLAAQLDRFSQAGDEAAALAGGLPEVLCDLWR